MKIDELSTPCVLVDLDILESNIQKMANFCKVRKKNLRPHSKSHKSPFIGKKQIDAGAVGLCCQTIGEAEGMMMNGLDHILLTHLLASRNHIERFLSLNRNGDIAIDIDGPENAGILAQAARHRGQIVNVIIEVNVGGNKTGLDPSSVERFAQWVSNQEGLRFKGLIGYEGFLQLSIPDQTKRRELVFKALDKLALALDEVRRSGLNPEIITGGGTGTYNIACDHPALNEVQPGSYVMMDRRYKEIEPVASEFGTAMTLLSTVVSTPNPNQAVTDLGWKSVGLEYEIAGWGGMPVVPATPELKYFMGGDEHGILKCEKSSNRPNVGDMIRFLPAHCDTALNLYGHFYGVRGDNVEVICPIVRR